MRSGNICLEGGFEQAHRFVNKELPRSPGAPYAGSSPSLLALGLSLTTVGVGFALSILDSDLAEVGVPAFSDASSTVPPASHDHRLCILYQSSPGVATSDATPTVDRFVACGGATESSVAWTSPEQTEKPTARAPPHRS